MPLIIHSSCFELEDRIYIFQLQKCHLLLILFQQTSQDLHLTVVVTNPVSTHKWGPTSYRGRNDTDLSVVLFQHTRDDLNFSCRNGIDHSLILFQARRQNLHLTGAEMPFLLLILFQHTIEDLHLTVAVTNPVSLHNWGSLPYNCRMMLIVLYQDPTAHKVKIRNCY